MQIFLTILHVIVCLILILVILLQAGRGQGLTSAAFGGGNVQSVFGTRAADFMTKATSVAAICFLLTCIGLNIIEASKSKSLLSAGAGQNLPLDLDQLNKAIEDLKGREEASGEVAKEAAAAAGPAQAEAESAGQPQAAG